MAAQLAVVLVHGAWHSSLHFQNVLDHLRKAGHHVTAVDLPSSSNTDVDAALEKDALVVKAAIESHTAAGRDVVLVMHSYGGLAGSEGLAAYMSERKISAPHTGRVVHLLYVAAIILEPGVSLLAEDVTPHVLDEECGVLHHLEPFHRFYNTTAPSVARRAMSTLKPQVANSFTASVKSAAWRDHAIPVTYICCEQDMALPAAVDQARFIKRLESANIKELQIVRIDCDHSPWLSAEGRFMEITHGCLKRSQSGCAAHAVQV